MTVTPPRKRRARHLVASRIAALLAAATLAVGLATPIATAQASPATPSPTPTAGPAPGTTAITLAPIRNGILNPGDALTASVTLQNGTSSPTAATDVTLALGEAPLGDRAALTTWLDGDTSGVVVSPVGTATIEAVGPDDQRTASVMVPADSPALTSLEPGVYPLSATYEGPAGAVGSTSVVVVPSGTPIAVGVVVPITAGPQTDGLLTADDLTDLTSGTGSLTHQLDGVEGTGAILAIDPAIPAAIRVLGTAAPETATAWLERLESLANTRFALQFGDADPAVQVEAGISRPVGPTTLEPFMRATDFPVTAAATPAPAPTTTDAPTARTTPTLDELVDIGGERQHVFWPSGDAVTPAAVETLGAISIDDERALTLVPSTAVTAGTSVARAKAGDAELLIADADVSRALSEAAVLDESALRGAPLAAASAYLALAGGEVVIAAVDRGTDRSNVGLRTAISAAADFPGASAQSLTMLATGAAQAVEVTDAAAPAARVSEASSLFDDEDELSRFATILDDPTLLTGVERTQILQLLGVAWAALPAESTEAVTEHRLATATTLTSVRLLPSPTINLLAAGAGLPFTVRNDLPYSVNLVLYATPDDLRLNVRRANDIVATPLSNTPVEVPVEARVGNGEVTLDLQLRSPSFVAIGPSDSVEVNVRAEWEAVGLTALGIIVGGLVILGIVRTVLRVRARRKTTTDAAPPAPDESAAS